MWGHVIIILKQGDRVGNLALHTQTAIMAVLGSLISLIKICTNNMPKACKISELYTV
jgi:hypothetical protein